MLHLIPPADGNILLHACCAPCSSAIVECMLQNDIRPTLFFFNPNIFPREEYEVRKNEAKRFAQAQDIPFVDADYDYERWKQAIRGLEKEPERGARCERCFLIRLAGAAHYASTHGFTIVATTLASSRWKDITQVNTAGKAAVAPYHNVIFWEQNWRKGGLQDRRNALLHQYNFYNQQYCGCEFSRRRHPLPSPTP